MRIVDAQIHLWTNDKAPPHHRRAPYMIDEALRDMAAAGVGRAVNCPAIWDPLANDYAAEAARRHPDKFATLGWFPLDDKADAAVFAHLDDVQPPGRRRVHPVPALELSHHALDAAFDTEWLAAADAAERLFLLEDANGGP